jgi:hypothetical protein
MRSKAQRRYLHAKKPSVARRFEQHTPKGKQLPQRKRRKGRRRGQ